MHCTATDEQRRNLNIDFMRGLVMLLLPLFHSVDGDSFIYYIIGLYHMPLLMMISGYLSYSNTKEIDIMWVRRRWKRLLIPFVFWSFVCLIPLCHNYETGEFVQLIFSGRYWFLIVLSVFALLIWGITNARKLVLPACKYNFVIMMFATDIFLKGVSVISDFSMISLCAWHITFYFAGYCIHRFYIHERFIKHNQHVLAAVSVVAFCMLVFMSVYCITIFLPDKVKKKFRILSVYSMYIYILHFFLLRDYVEIALLNIIIESIAGVLVPVLIGLTVKRFCIKPVAVLFGD